MEKPLKLLVRSWHQGKGCVHQRSAAMSEAEARELLEVGRGAIDRAQESGGIEQIPLAKGRAYVKARRVRDPDEPSRMAPGFVLVSIPDPDVFIREVVAREFDELLQSAANATLDQIPSPGEGNLGKRGWKIIDLGRPSVVSKNKTRSRVPGRRQLGLIALLVAIVAVYVAYQETWRASPNQDGNPGSRAVRTNDDPDPEASNWKEVREQIKQVLEAKRAQALIDQKTPSNATNRDVVRRFAVLFKRPDLKKELSGNEELSGNNFRCYGIQTPANHPFVAFLSRLPEKIPELPDGKPDLTPTEAVNYLKELDGALQESKSFQLDLDLGTPRTLADKTKRCLNYPVFFKTWLKEIRLNDTSRGYWENNQWDESRTDDVAYLWVKPIRDLIKARYSWR